MYKIRITAKARQDLKDLLKHGYQVWGIHQTDTYYDQLFEKINLLKSYPMMGIKCDSILPNYRKIQIKKHVFFYKISTDHILIIRVMHEKMDYQDHL